MAEIFNLTITGGAENYQIFQQENGFAQIELTGKIEMSEEIREANARVVVHLIDENSGSLVIPPVTADLNGEDWHAAFKAPTGGLYTIRTFLRSAIRDERTGDMISHIGVGDIYLIAGQSNAEGHSKRGIYDPVSMQVHMLRLNGKWDIAAHPLSDCTGSEYKCFKDRKFVGYHTPWLQFAKLVNASVSYPIGLLPSAIGGVPLSFFDKQEDGQLFDDMIEIVKSAGGKIKGVLWYQGCSDTSDNLSVTYLERFKRVVKNTREALGYDVPFITVQLNKQTYFGNESPVKRGELWATVREAQRQAAHQIDNIYIIPSVDLQVCDTIHNQPYSNMVIAERAANVALKYIYGKQNPCEAPDIERAVLEENRKVVLYFNNVYDAIATDYYFADALPFQIKDSVGTQNITDYECTGDNRIILHFDRDISLPATVGCTKFTDSGFMPYDYTTRLPVLCFNNINIE